ncbi:hypothetical protein HDU79_004980, partial [Rhizoclosmatium sp. JEL0117]
MPTPLVTSTTSSFNPFQFADDIANQIAAGAIPPYSPLLAIDTSVTQKVVDSITTLLKSEQYKLDPLLLAQSLGLMFGSLYPSQTFSFTAVPLNESTPFGKNGAVLANEFVLLFEDLCTRFIQPMPSITVVNRILTFIFNETATQHILHFKYSVTDINGRTLAGIPYPLFMTDTSSRRRDVITLDSTSQISYDGCGPVVAHMKYDLCEGSVIGGNSCNGNVTAHLKYPEVDLTKIPGSGYDEQICKPIPIDNSGVATMTGGLSLNNGIEKSAVVSSAAAPSPVPTLAISSGEDVQSHDSNSGKESKQTKTILAAGSLIGSGGTADNEGVQSLGGVLPNGNSSQFQHLSTDPRPKSPGSAMVLNGGGSDILVNQPQEIVIPVTTQSPEPLQIPSKTLVAGNNIPGSSQPISMGATNQELPNNSPILEEPVIQQSTSSVVLTSKTISSVVYMTVTSNAARNAAATTTAKKSSATILNPKILSVALF